GDGFSIVGGVAANQVLDSLSRDNGHDGYDNSGTDTLFTDNKSKENLGADLAGIGDGTGTVDAASAGNTVSDESGLEAEQELELDTLAALPGRGRGEVRNVLDGRRWPTAPPPVFFWRLLRLRLGLAGGFRGGA